MNDENHPEEKQKNIDQSHPDKDELNGLVSSVLKPLFRFVNKVIPSKLKRSRYAWSLMSILILLVLIQFEVINLIIMIITVGMCLFLELASLNYEDIWTFFKDKDKGKIEDFLNQMYSYNLQEILGFLNKYDLCTNQLIQLLGTPYKMNPDLHAGIIYFQDYDCDFVDFLVKQKVMEKLPPHLVARYILKCSTSLNLDTVQDLNKIKHIDVIGSLLLTNPLSFQANTGLKKILNPLLSFCLRLTRILKKGEAVFLLLISFTASLSLLSNSILKNITKQKLELIFIFIIFIMSFILSMFLISLIRSFHIKVIIPFWGYIYRGQSNH